MGEQYENLTLYVIPCFLKLNIIDIICSNCCHLVSDFSSKFQSSTTIFHHINVKMLNICTEVSWDDSICKIIHKKCHWKSYHNVIKCHMTLDTILSVVFESCFSF